VATPELAAAVGEAGALGMVNMTMIPADDVAIALDTLAKVTTGPVGMNVLMPFLDVAAVEAAASRLRVVEFFYGEPDAALVARVHEGGALAAWQVGSLIEAERAVDAGCDFIVAQGIEAGGHVRGQVSLLPLLDAVLDAVEVSLPSFVVAVGDGVA
jgi:NAD(P)H-dependent flavin oxidoreductase YrpB (nitropropane dioxygenase family)